MCLDIFTADAYDESVLYDVYSESGLQLGVCAVGKVNQGVRECIQAFSRLLCSMRQKPFYLLLSCAG